MARRRVAEVDPHAEHDAVKDWYREALAAPASFPWEGLPWEPVRIGPTWATANGHWVLPERTIGWEMLGWCGTNLQHGAARPWRFTLEQARFLLWWYAIDDTGRFLFRDGVLQRLKGWGKDPIGACIGANELLGPARFAEWYDDEPVATDVPAAWVQTAATALDQTKNTMRLLPGLFTPAAKRRYRIQIGRELVYALNDSRFLQAVTSSPATLEGARATFVLKNETHHWLANNEGHEMAATIERNATKSEGGVARTLAITNAYEPSEESVAQQDREAYEDAEAGESLTTGILYDSLEAPPEAPLSAEAARDVVLSIRGDSVWLDPDRIVQSILDTRNPASRSRRFWYNQVTAAEDAWIVPAEFDACAAPPGYPPVLATDPVVAFFDGSKSDDATAIVACRVSDGYVFTVGVWQKPAGERGKGWTAPRATIDLAVATFFDRHTVVGYFGDPSHTRDDETLERYWDDLIDEWHRRYKARLKLWSVPGPAGHAVAYDMVAPSRVEAFTAAAERCAGDIADGSLVHDGDARLRIHAHNARRYPNRYGVSLWKGHRESKRKIDAAVCMVGARMVRRLVLNAQKGRERSGEVW